MRPVVAALSLLCFTSVVRANPEPPAYDARVVGMGGTALAYLDSPAALFHNPAGLQGIDQLEISAALTTIIVDLQAPVGGPMDEAHTGWRVAPLGFLGGAGRVHERVVLGLGAYIQTGYGGEFENVEMVNGQVLDEPQDLRAILWVGELAVASSFRLAPSLDVGLVLRFPYASQKASVYQEVFPDTWRMVDQNVSGIGRIPGILLGVTARPIPELSLAMTYRSKTRIDMDGTTDVELTPGRPIAIDTETSWSVPHALGFAIAYDATRWLATAEIRWQLHGEANRIQVFDLDFVGVQDIRAPFYWRNIISFRLGGEVGVGPVDLRAGYNASMSATTEAGVQSFMPPPGVLQAAYIGIGGSIGPIDLDFAVQYSWGKEYVEARDGACVPGDQVKVGCEGEYGVRTTWVSVSMRYVLGR